MVDFLALHFNKLLLMLTLRCSGILLMFMTHSRNCSVVAMVIAMVAVVVIVINDCHCVRGHSPGGACVMPTNVAFK